jgi:hypothetical protein
MLALFGTVRIYLQSFSLSPQHKIVMPLLIIYEMAGDHSHRVYSPFSVGNVAHAPLSIHLFSTLVGTVEQAK